MAQHIKDLAVVTAVALVIAVAWVQFLAVKLLHAACVSEKRKKKKKLNGNIFE